MLEAGGLIKLHYHRNFDLLELFTDVDQTLYYRDKSLFWNLELSHLDHNHLVKKNDGLFVDGTFLDRFDYHDNELYFDNIIVSREYPDNEITAMIESLWSTNPYTQVGKIDLSYWFELVSLNSKTQSYRNNSDMTMTLQVSNPNNQSLKIEIDDGTVMYNNSLKFNITLLPGRQVIIRENSLNDLENIVVTLQ